LRRSAKRQASSPENAPPLVRLAKRGTPAELAAQIERALDDST
jgi:hypothetical protein